MRNTKKSIEDFHHDFGDRTVAAKSKHAEIFIKEISVRHAEALARTIDVSVWIRKSQTKKATLIAKESFQKTPEGSGPNGLVRCEYFLRVHDTILISIREKSSTWKTSKTTKTGMVYEEAFELIEANSGEPKVGYLLLLSHDVRITFAKESDFNRLHGVQVIKDLASKHKPLLDRLGKSIEYITYILHNADNLTMGHAELAVILIVLRTISNALSKWRKMHMSILGLVEKIVSVAEYIIEANKVASLDKLEKTIQDTWELFDKTRDLVFDFIQKKNSIKMLLPPITIRMSQDIENLGELFDKVIKSFDRGMAVQTLQKVEQLNTAVHDINKNGEKLDKKLERLENGIFNHVIEKLLRPGVHYELPIESSPQGAQLIILNKVMDWARDSSSQHNIFALPEIPGEDDLAIASAVVRVLNSNKRLSSFFFFDSDVPQKTAAVCVRRIAYDLAKQPGFIQDKISGILTDRPHFLEATPTVEMYEGLVHEPLSARYSNTNSINNPFVVVIGAADECTSPSDREALLSILKRWKNLPSHCKLVISGCENNHPEKIRPQKPRRVRQITEIDSKADPPGPPKDPHFEQKTQTHVVHHIIQQSRNNVILNVTASNHPSNFHAPKQTAQHESEPKNTSSHVSVVGMDHILEPTTPCFSATTEAVDQITKNTQHSRANGPSPPSVCSPNTSSSSSIPLYETAKINYVDSESFSVPKSPAIACTPTPEVDQSLDCSAPSFSKLNLQESINDAQVDDRSIRNNTSALVFSSLMPDAGNGRLATSKRLLSTLTSPAVFSSSSFSSSHALVMSILGQSAPFATRMLLSGAGRENIPSIRDAIAYLGGDAFMKIRSRFAWSAEDCPGSDSDGIDEESEYQPNEHEPSSDETACTSSPTDTTANLSSDAEESDQQVPDNFISSTLRSSAPTLVIDSSNGPTLSGQLYRIVGDKLVEGTNKASGMYSGLVHRSSLVRSHLNGASEGLREKNDETDSRDAVISEDTTGDNKVAPRTQMQMPSLLPRLRSQNTPTGVNTSIEMPIRDGVFNDDSTIQTVLTLPPTRKDSWLNHAQTAKERLSEGMNDVRPSMRDGVMGIAASATAWGTNSFASLQHSGISSTWRPGWPGRG